MRFKITMTQLVDNDELDYDDRLDLGEHGLDGSFVAATIDAVSEEDALDRFHASVPIGVLENYEINIEEKP
jgi:hypothetical protein